MTKKEDKNVSEEHKNIEEKVIQAAKDKFDIKPDDLKDFQKDCSVAIIEGFDASIVQPPGGGKSVCFVLPGLILNKRSLVIEPVTPLMFDQKQKLEKKGLKVVMFTEEDMEEGKNEDVDDQIKDMDIIFSAPDALFSDDGAQTKLLKALKKLNEKDGFAVIALDEAHLCWHAFQSQYKQLLTMKDLFPTTPLLALTGTATLENRKRLLTEFLRKDKSKEFWASMDLPHIEINCKEVHGAEDTTAREGSKEGNEDDKSKTSPEHWKEVVELVAEETKGEPSVLFFDNIEACETLEEAFKKYAGNLKILTYHGDKSPDEQAKILKSWIDGKASLVIATTAFGHGVDRPDVRHVYRLGVPQSVEEWVQEVGRAGRDKKPARATLLWHEVNPAEMKFKGINKEQAAEARKRVEAVLHLCKCKTCRRAAMLEYFGEKQEEAKCGKCDACLGNSGHTGIKMEAHKTDAKLDL